MINHDAPGDRAPGTDGLNGLFFKLSRVIIKQDIANVFNAFWSLDMRSEGLPPNKSNTQYQKVDLKMAGNAPEHMNVGASEAKSNGFHQGTENP